jgi:hypothetical protein
LGFGQSYSDYSAGGLKFQESATKFDVIASE